MATRFQPRDDLASLPALLAAIPSLPRPVLSRLTARLIERMDELDGNADLEDSEASSPHVDAKGRWIGPVSLGMTDDDEEDDPPEDEHDREMTEEREPELYEGGHPDLRDNLNRFHITA